MLYLLIYKYGPITKKEIIERTKIKKTTLVRMLDELLENKFIKESGYLESSVGRRPILYDIQEDINYIIGIHITRMKMSIVLLNLKCKQITQESFKMTTMHTPDFCLMLIQRSIQGFMEKYHFGTDDLLGIGVAAIGPLNYEEGIIIEPEFFLAPNWRNVPIVRMIQDMFPVKVIMQKGANAGVMAEYHETKFNHKNILYLVSGGWVIDCGVLINGTVLHDQYADAGAYAHMIIDADGKECFCGKKGCMIAYTSFKNILHELKEENIMLGNISEELLQKASPTDMVEYFKQGDQLIQEVILRSTHYLSVGLSNLIHLFNPELVVLNGPFIYEIDGYYEQIVKNTKQNLHIKRDLQFSQGTYKENTAAMGAAILLFNSYFEE
ncbi:ROK family transcriptional regulator, partial [Bacillus sp. JJ722]|uniref:ROK family transcriptional regulator n=1 Tax=Bacillus sp. JJ722 TaxID=3122973 RepID=UPI002FFD5ADF